jgi:hypothetical protein
MELSYGAIMKNALLYLVVLLTAAATSHLFAQPATASVNPANDLIKVTGSSGQKCVEYYNYKGGMYCSTKALNSNPINSDMINSETQTIVFDQRAWQAAWGKKGSDGITIEYVPMGDDINNWNELITSQFFPGLQKKATPKEFAAYIIESMKKSGYKPIVTIHQDTPEQCIFEFRIESPTNQEQDEIQKVTKGSDGLYVLHYVIKKPDMGKDNRKLWLSNLNKSTVRGE